MHPFLKGIKRAKFMSAANRAFGLKLFTVTAAHHPVVGSKKLPDMVWLKNALDYPAKEIWGADFTINQGKAFNNNPWTHFKGDRFSIVLNEVSA